MVLENKATARLFAYNMKTKQLHFLLSHLAFANGIELHEDGDSILINECKPFFSSQLCVCGVYSCLCSCVLCLYVCLFVAVCALVFVLLCLMFVCVCSYSLFVCSLCFRVSF